MNCKGRRAGHYKSSTASFFFGTVVIFYFPDGPVASLFQNMRDLFLFGRLYRFAFSGTVVIFYSLDGYIASLFQDMRDLFLFGRLYRFAFSGTVVIFYSLDSSVASFFQDMRDLSSKRPPVHSFDHAARQSGPEEKARNGFLRCDQRSFGLSRGTNIRSEKYCIGKTFHS